MNRYVDKRPAWQDERRRRRAMDLYAHAVDDGEEEIWCDPGSKR